MTAVIGLLGGALVRYLPNVFGFFGDWFKGKEEVKNEASMLQLSIDLERARADAAAKTVVTEGEQTRALVDIQNALEEMRLTISDRQSARQFGGQIHTALVNVLQVGVSLGLPRWVLSVGWSVVVAVEALGASVQPGIAVCGFALWASWKISLFLNASADGTVNIAAALLSTWTESDWLLIDSILGFFLAGRAQKYEDSKAPKPCAG